MKKEMNINLSDISTMKYDLQKDNIIERLSKLEDKIRIKCNIKETEKLIDIECYTSQVYFNFAKTWLRIDCFNLEFTKEEKYLIKKYKKTVNV